MVKDELWESVADQRELLCLSCFEERINREVSASDLRRMPDGSEAPCNGWLNNG